MLGDISKSHRDIEQPDHDGIYRYDTIIGRLQMVKNTVVKLDVVRSFSGMRRVP